MTNTFLRIDMFLAFLIALPISLALWALIYFFVVEVVL